MERLIDSNANMSLVRDNLAVSFCDLISNRGQTCDIVYSCNSSSSLPTIQCDNTM